MDPISLSWIEKVTKAQRTGSRCDRLITNVVTDSREVGVGSLYVARQGQRLNGRDFINKAFEQGAAAALVTFEPGDFDRSWPGPVLIVPDATHALVQLASAYRDTLTAKVIAITGSVGKTTTKDMLFTALEGERRVVKAQKSYNNIVGVPLTLLSASRSSEVVIVEVGTNAPGEIDALGAIVRPDIAVLTGVGYSHLAGLGSVHGVAAEKSCLFKHLRPYGVAFLNGDNIHCRAIAASLRQRRGHRQTVTVGFQYDCDWTGTASTLVTADPGSRSRFHVEGGPTLSLAVPGEHNLRNALMAFAIAVELGLPSAVVARNLMRIQSSPGRLHVARGLSTVLDDSYNANPSSMRAALECFTLFAAHKPRTAILGSMLELGADSEAYHRSMGRLVVRTAIERLVTVGEEARAIAEEALRLGYDAERVHCFATVKDAKDHIEDFSEVGMTYLVKGSNAVGLSQLVEDLRQAKPARQPRTTTEKIAPLTHKNSLSAA